MARQGNRRGTSGGGGGGCSGEGEERFLGNFCDAVGTEVGLGASEIGQTVHVNKRSKRF